jgi:hypothetical protein
MSNAMTAGTAIGADWVEEKIAQRHQSVRLRLMRELHERHKTQRQKRRDVARLLLAASVVFLGVVMVEFGRKTHALSISTIEHSRNAG